ncbi:MAG: YggS family pyridoxal phosphate-dependent enzyme [Chloroflexota bacterium]
MATQQPDVDALRASRERILERIAAAAARAGRRTEDVMLVAVSKTVAAERLRAAVAAGITLLGENRVQEAASKAPDVPGARWHLVGPLQSNKARRAVELFDVVQTVDSVDLGQRLDRIAAELRPGRRLDVLVQVNVDLDPHKAGVSTSDAAAVVEGLGGCANLAVRGLMTVGRLTTEEREQRATFAGLRTLADELRATLALGPELSMGMSDDFEIAIEEGATIVRVGRAIFGERQAPA